MTKLEDLLDMYWDLAYAEGHSHGKESYGTKANETRHKIRALLQSQVTRAPMQVTRAPMFEFRECEDSQAAAPDPKEAV